MALHQLAIPAFLPVHTRQDLPRACQVRRITNPCMHPLECTRWEVQAPTLASADHRRPTAIDCSTAAILETRVTHETRAILETPEILEEMPGTLEQASLRRPRVATPRKCSVMVHRRSTAIGARR